MQNFDYVTPTRLIFGKGVVEQLPEVMRQYGKRILLTYGGGSIKKIGLYDKVKTLLSDFEIVELSGNGLRLCVIRLMRCNLSVAEIRRLRKAFGFDNEV